MAAPTLLVARTGRWQGTNRLWLSPEDPVRESPSRAVVALLARGQFATIRYTWFEDDEQEGMLVISQERGSDVTQAVWVDSWHMGSRFMPCEGVIEPSGAIRVKGFYPAPTGPDWGWIIAFEPLAGGGFRMVMYNVTPDGQEMLAVDTAYARDER